ncbi:MAG: PqqD family protein [Clostridium sp.]|jgi:hypothetical protein|nr:PqqD family protein [Clostridium sp.]
MTKRERYQLRHVAGIYWVLDMAQSGERYVKPITMNETGAFLFQMWQEDRTARDMIQALCKRYFIDDDIAKEDVQDFLAKWTTT